MVTQFYTSKTEMVVSALRELILGGELAPGDLLRQRELAVRFGVSQTPVREALQRLESEGLVNSDAHRGAWVTESDMGSHLENSLVRAAVESFAASLAALKIAPEGLEELRGVNAKIRELPDGDASYHVLNKEFHFAIYAAAQSPVMMAMMRILWRALDSSMYPLKVRSHGESADQHEEIIDALADRDPDLASTLVRSHIMSALPAGSPIADELQQLTTQRTS